MKEYPVPRVEKKNLAYANLLRQDYAGEHGEDTAIHQYLYEHLLVNDDSLKKVLRNIMISEMHHLELLGATILLLGADPTFAAIDSNTFRYHYWTSRYVNDSTSLKELLECDIKLERKTIQTYQIHRDLIDDKYIKELLTVIIEEEKEHLKIFQEYHQFYCQ